MQELKKKIEATILGLSERIVKTNMGDLLVKTVGSKFVHVYNLDKQKKEQYTLKDFAFFALGREWDAAIYDELVRESFDDLWMWEQTLKDTKF